MKIELTKLKFRALNTGFEKAEDIANELGIDVDIVKGWEINDMGYLLARNYFKSFHVALFNNNNCAKLLNDIRLNIVIKDES